MAITYELSIQEMEASPSEGELENVVKIIHWTYIGSEGEGDNKICGDANGAVGLTDPSSDSFTAFTDLTEQQVKGWVQSQIDEVAIKADINSQIESQKNPPVVIKKNPWSGEDEI